MPASKSPPPSLRGIVFVLFLLFLFIAAPVAAFVWLAVVLPWQATVAVVIGYLIGYRVGSRTT
jgi:hypothetical protein